MKRIVIDTDIFIDFLRGYPKSKRFLKKVRDKMYYIYFSAISEAELLSGEECNSISKREGVTELLSIGSKLIVDNQIARKAGEFRRRYKINLIDAIIVASAFCNKANLVSRNLIHFSKIKEVKILKPYD